MNLLWKKNFGGADMLNTKLILPVMVACFLLFSCQPTYVPSSYRISINKVETNTYGSWMKVMLKQPINEIGGSITTGELITIQYDSVYILVKDHQMHVLSINSIADIELFTHKNQSGTYAAMSMAFFVPNIIGAIATGYAQFLLLGVPVLVTGLILAAVESSKQENILIYPDKNNLQELRKFARFPTGLPKSLDKESLLLKKEEEF